MRYTLIASFESQTCVHVVVRRFWFMKSALRLKMALDNWHNIGGSNAVCCVGIIGPHGGWL